MIRMRCFGLSNNEFSEGKRASRPSPFFGNPKHLIQTIRSYRIRASGPCCSHEATRDTTRRVVCGLIGSGGPPLRPMRPGRTGAASHGASPARRNSHLPRADLHCSSASVRPIGAVREFLPVIVRKFETAHSDHSLLSISSARCILASTEVIRKQRLGNRCCDT